MNDQSPQDKLTDLIVDGFHRLDDHLIERNPPKITFLDGFYKKEEPLKLTYLIKLASTMNHAAKLVSDERDQLLELMVKKEKQLEQMEKNVRANNEMLNSEVQRMNEKRQGFNDEIMRLTKRVKELERGDND